MNDTSGRMCIDMNDVKMDIHIDVHVYDLFSDNLQAKHDHFDHDMLSIGMIKISFQNGPYIFIFLISA